MFVFVNLREDFYRSYFIFGRNATGFLEPFSRRKCTVKMTKHETLEQLKKAFSRILLQAMGRKKYIRDPFLLAYQFCVDERGVKSFTKARLIQGTRKFYYSVS